MDRIDAYRQIIKHLLSEYAQHPPSYGQIKMETIFDTEQDRYELLAVGWQDTKRVHNSVIHIDIIDDKVWLQHNSTDLRIAEMLVERGIPRDQIVLGFQPEYSRQYTAFAAS
jgi:muramidase (phage lysozyme)